MNESKVQAYYRRYQVAVNYYGYRRLRHCYIKPSPYKCAAENRIEKEIFKHAGYGYTVISYNTSIFTCGYLFDRGGETWFCVHTPTDRGEMKIC